MWTVCLMLPCSWDVYCTCRMTVHTYVHVHQYLHTLCVAGFWLYAGASYCSDSCIIVSVLYRLLNKKFSIFLFATLFSFCQIFLPDFIESFTVWLKNLFLCLYICLLPSEFINNVLFHSLFFLYTSLSCHVILVFFKFLIPIHYIKI